MLYIIDALEGISLFVYVVYADGEEDGVVLDKSEL